MIFNSEWQLEPELANSSIPRRLKHKSVTPSFIIQWVLLVLAVGMSCGFFTIEVIHRNEILGHGFPATARVATVHVSKRSATTLFLNFTTRSGQQQAVSVDLDADFQDHTDLQGKTLSIHYLPNRPSMVELDKPPFGSNPSAILLLLALICIIVIGVFIVRRRKMRYLLQWGEVVGAKIEKIVWRRGNPKVFFGYDLNGVQEHSFCISAASFLELGQIVTAFVDPQNPCDAVLYQECPYEVVP